MPPVRKQQSVLRHTTTRKQARHLKSTQTKYLARNPRPLPEKAETHSPYIIFSPQRVSRAQMNRIESTSSDDPPLYIVRYKEHGIQSCVVCSKVECNNAYCTQVREQIHKFTRKNGRITVVSLTGQFPKIVFAGMREIMTRWKQSHGFVSIICSVACDSNKIKLSSNIDLLQD